MPVKTVPSLPAKLPEPRGAIAQTPPLAVIRTPPDGSFLTPRLPGGLRIGKARNTVLRANGRKGG